MSYNTNKKLFVLFLVAFAMPLGCNKDANRVCAPVNNWHAPVYSCSNAQMPKVAVNTGRIPSRVVLRAGKIEILEKVQFETASATLLSDSTSLLDEVASTLREHPEISKVRVEGHTDSDGARDYNLGLSRDRAASVMDYLVNQGVESTRLTAEGYGPDQPIADNDTAEGKEKNRRVEFTILERVTQDM